MRKRQRKKWSRDNGCYEWTWTPYRKGDPIESWQAAFIKSIHKGQAQDDRQRAGLHDRYVYRIADLEVLQASPNHCDKEWEFSA
jgi:hypothetical protein